MADFASWSFHLSDHEFLTEFSSHFPLPPQLTSWTLVHLRPAATSPVISALQRSSSELLALTVLPGLPGNGLPPSTTKTLAWPPYSAHCMHGTELTCSWPLLSPCGQVDTTKGTEFCQRRSRKRYETAPRSLSLEAELIPGSSIQALPPSILSS